MTTRMGRRLAASILGMLLVAPVVVIPVAAADPSPLDGSIATRSYGAGADDPMYPIEFGPDTPAGCDPNGTSVVPFAGEALVNVGPFSGQHMTFSGSVTVGPQSQTDVRDFQGEPYPPLPYVPTVGVVTGATGSFTFEDGSGTTVDAVITGVAPPVRYRGEQNIGSCYGVGPGNHFGRTGVEHGTLIGLYTWVDYSANVNGEPVTGRMQISESQPCVVVDSIEGCDGFNQYAFLFRALEPADDTPPRLDPQILVDLPGGGATSYIAVGDLAYGLTNATDSESGIESESCDPIDTATGGTRAITCRATNREGLTTEVQVEYTVDGNDPPVPEILSYTTLEDTAVAVDIYASDPDADALTFTVTVPPTKGLLTGTSPSFTYTPTNDANGADSIGYSIYDGVITVNAVVDISITPYNDNPAFTAGPDQTVPANAGPTSISGWATNIVAGPPNEAYQSVNFVVVGNDNPGLFAAGPAVSPSGTLTFTPARRSFGVADVIVCLRDSESGDPESPIQTCHDLFVEVTFVPIQLPSFTKGGDQAVLEDAGPRTVAGWATNISKGSAPTVTFDVATTNAALFSAAPAIDPTTGTLTYTPAANAFGTATVTVTLTGDDGATPPQTFKITVSPVNDAPSFRGGGNRTINEDSGPQVIAWADLITKGPANESGQTVSFEITANTNPGLFSAGPAVSPTGTLTFSLAANRAGTALVAVRIRDNGGTTNGGVNASAAQALRIDVAPVNDPPVARTVTMATSEDTNKATYFLGSDLDGDALTYTIVTQPTGGHIFKLAVEGPFRFEPTPDWNGSTTFNYSVSDGQSSAVGLVRITVTPVPDVPIPSINDAVTIDEGTKSPTIRFFDPDSQSASEYTATYRLGDGTPVDDAKVNSDGTVIGVFTDLPYKRFGTFTATATLKDRRDGSATATRRVIVTDAPLDTITLAAGSAKKNLLWDLRTTCVRDANPFGLLADLSATIDWGDGTSASIGNVRKVKGSDACASFPWVVDSAGHKYARVGTFTIRTTIRSVGGNTVVGTLRVVVT